MRGTAVGGQLALVLRQAGVERPEPGQPSSGGGGGRSAGCKAPHTQHAGSPAHCCSTYQPEPGRLQSV